jgi:polyhydroxyalkanoate synthesis repressor PhaR
VAAVFLELGRLANPISCASGDHPGAMKSPRVITKYSNRRLYDTADSRYITLSDIRQLVIDDTPFKVIDKKSDQDITRYILLHVIAEHEERGESMMSEDFLCRLIRAYGDDTPEVIRGYLEETLSLFLEQQQTLKTSIRDGFAATSLEAVAEIAQRSAERWEDLQKQLAENLEISSPEAEKPTSSD